MFFNNDLLFVAATSSIIVGGVILTYSFYNDRFPTVNKGESLINTNYSAQQLNYLSKLDSNIQLDNLPNHSYVDAVVQTEVNVQVEAGIQAANTYVNTGMQTSARMWLESIKNWITEILDTNNNPNPNYVDVGVQTNAPSLWGTVKQWFLEVCSVRSSELTSIGENKVNKWRNKLDSTQSVDLHDSESPLTILRFGIESDLQNLVVPDDSASNISEVISEAKLQDVENRVYDVTDPVYLNLLMADETIDLEVIDNVNYAVSDNLLLSIDPSIIHLFI